MKLIDTHCHIDDPRFDIDRKACLSRAHQNGIGTLIIPSIKVQWWSRVKSICAESDTLLPAYGLHPMYEPEHQDTDIKILVDWLDREKPIAIGECGLDFYIPNPNRDRQLALFDAQLKLSQERNLPLIIHARKAVEEAIKLVKKHPGIRGVFHSFSGSLQQGQQLIDLGFKLGFGGPVTYDRASRLRKIIKQLPLDAIVLETDAPDQPAQLHRGERNEPAFLSEICTAISTILEITDEELQQLSSNNARGLFQLSC